jgi:type IV pilus assembly protein PilC
MPEFQYQGVDKAGKRVTGKIDAPTEGDLRMMLRGMGIRPMRISKVSALNADLGSLLTGGGGKVSGESMVVFTRQLNVLISAGIPLVQALEVLAEQATERSMRNIITAIREKVSSGSYLWEAMNGYPKAFPKLYIALVRAGEAAGAMDQVLKRLSRYLEDADRLKKMVKGAMMYPIIVVGIGIAVVTALLVFVIPKFEDLLKSSGQELPAPTQFVIDASKFLTHNGLWLVLGIGTFGYLMLRYVKSAEGRAVMDQVLFRIPLFGNIMQKSGVARFSRTMQTLLSSGVNLMDAIDICRATIDNAVLEASVAKIRSEVEAGKTLGAVITSIPTFPRMAVQMISVGESTGSLDKMLEKVADFYEAEVEALVSGMMKLIEPFILVFLGTVVGGMLIAMYLPIFKLAGGAQ